MAKTRSDALQKMTKLMGKGLKGYTFQWTDGHFGWCSEESSTGAACEEALRTDKPAPILLEGKPVLGRTGRPIAVDHVERVTS